jgi:triosephosphate isomerase
LGHINSMNATSTNGLRPLVAGNWKMNGGRLALRELGLMGEGYDAGLRGAVDLLVCPPATLVQAAAVFALGSRVAVGAQDCHAEDAGAFTGDISATMLADLGASAVIVGHSERRAGHGESSALVRAKCEAAWRSGLMAVVCIGETLAERDAGKTLSVIGRQLSGSVPDGASAANTVIAYEPVWAIGTGRTPTNEQIVEVHGAIRKALVRRFKTEGRGMRILYGGSVKPSNAGEILKLPEVNGALVGGASLKAADFLAIAAAYR